MKYFEIRTKWERHEYVIPVTEDLEFLADARERFRGSEIESLYQSWLQGPVGTRELPAKISEQKPERAIFFDTYLVNGSRESQAESAEPGDRCMEDTDHTSVHDFVHLTGERKC